MKAIDKLEISFIPDVETYNSITKILGIEPIKEPGKSLETIPVVWIYKVVTTDQDPFFDSINTFLDILENKYESLSQIGIQRSNILIWYLYEYDQQCNMEFDPIQLKRLGDNGIKLCISCWEGS